MLVGHEPSFSQVIGQLIGGGRIVMKKGGLARVDVNSIDTLPGELVWLLAPKMLT
jgi:phosphohistidine phosphatase